MSSVRHHYTVTWVFFFFFFLSTKEIASLERMGKAFPFDKESFWEKIFLLDKFTEKNYFFID